MKKFVPLLLFVALLLPTLGLAQGNPILECNPGPAFNAQLCYQRTASSQQSLGAQGIFAILQNIGGFLLAAAGVIAGIAIIVAGLVWVSAGSNQNRVAAAKAIFKNGVIGALIIFAAGLIINTIVLIASNWQAFFS